ncbi:MAG: NYN domain-containing protein [Candidatus Hydrothermota bacterium]|nr:MAG: NYN domain-containing protein [Candidatus Hydrothermae bacterium]
MSFKKPRYPAKRARVGVFVDVQNMFYSAKEYYDGKVDFEKILENAVRGRSLITAIAYLVCVEDVDQSAFISVLERIGFTVRTKYLKRRSDGSGRGDWDMGIAIDALLRAPKLDVVVIVSGDGDFVELVHALKAMGVTVEVMSFPQNTSEELKRAADRYLPIDEDFIRQAHKLENEEVMTPDALETL